MHVAQSLECIDFEDVEPSMGAREGEVLVECPEFRVEEWELGGGEGRVANAEGVFAILTVVEGELSCGGREFAGGDFFLVPATAEGGAREIRATGEGARVLRTTLP